MDADEAPIAIRRDWRWAVASWPHERWVRWRQLSAELQDGLESEPTADDIRAADRAAYDLVVAGAEESEIWSITVPRQRGSA